MICDICHEAQATFLLGHLETGDQIAYCVPDFARFALDAAQAVLPPAEILTVLGIPAEGFSNGRPPTPPGAAKSKRGRKAEKQPEPEPEPAEGPPEMAAASPDE